MPLKSDLKSQKKMLLEINQHRSELKSTHQTGGDDDSDEDKGGG